MKKLLSILMSLGLILILVGCGSQETVSSNSQETATFIQKKELAEFFVTYTYDKNKDTVSKLKIESTESAEISAGRKENEELFATLKGIDGVVTSITEKDGKLISSVEVDLTKYKLSEIKESNNAILAGLLQSGFLIEDGDHVSFSKSKEGALKRGMTEQTKK